MALSIRDLRDAENLWRTYGPAISRTLASYEGDRHLREDLAQNVFLALLSSLSQVREARNPRAYVFRIAHNVAVDHVAREARRKSPEFPAEAADPGQNLESEVHAGQQQTHLLRAIRQLKLPYRQVIVLLLEGLSYSEIEEALGIGSSTVRVRVMRAKQQLQDLLDHAR